MGDDHESAAMHEAIGSVLGRTASGIFILTAGDGAGRATGMLASWVQQASFEPPMVSVAVHRDRYLHQWLGRSPRLALNIVADGQGHLLKHFGRGFEPDQPAFEGLETRRGTTGVPLLADALGHLEGEIAGQLEAGDHVVYLVQITAASTGAAFAQHPPMVHLRKNGFRY